MAKSGTANKTPETSVSLEKSARFEKLLGLFSENDQKFLINSSPEEFKAFLKKGGFPEDELLDARDSWISNSGNAPSTLRETTEEKKENKEKHKPGDQHLPEEKEKAEPLAEKPKTKPDEKLWGEGTEYSEPTPKQTFGKRAPSLKPNILTEQVTPNTLRETPKPNILRTPNRNATRQLPRISFRPQTRIINRLNRASRLSGMGKKAAGRIAQAGSRLAAQGAKLLFTTPAGWIILAVISLIILVVFIILFFFTGSPTETAVAGNCNGVSTSSYTATKTSPVILTAVNCTSIAGALTYKWSSSDTGIFSDPTSVSTTYTPSSDTVKDIVITITICSATDPTNCFTDSVTINPSGSATVGNVHYYCQYASAWNQTSCQIQNFGCTQSSVAMAMSTYRTDTFYNPLRVARDNGGVMGCSRGTTIDEFRNILVPYMKNAGYTVANSIASGKSFDIAAAKKYIDQGFVIVAGGPVWYQSTKQVVPGGHAFLIVGADPSNNTLSVFDPTYCPWHQGDDLTGGVRTMTPVTSTCSYTAFNTNGPTSSTCVPKNSGGNKYVFYILNGGHGWYYAWPVKK